MFRLQQQGWDQGVMDLLSKWQGWTDTVERSEAVHFEEESVLMAQLISHQQQMTEVNDIVSQHPRISADSFLPLTILSLLLFLFPSLCPYHSLPRFSHSLLPLTVCLCLGA